jgi:DNA-binding XRE family transcriptional regulator
MAKNLNISKPYLIQIELGHKKPSLNVYQRFGELFDFNPSYITTVYNNDQVSWFRDRLDSKNFDNFTPVFPTY